MQMILTSHFNTAMNIKLMLNLNPAAIKTAQQKGMFVVKGRPVFFTKKAVLESNYRIKSALIAALHEEGCNVVDKLVFLGKRKIRSTHEITVHPSMTIANATPVSIGIKYVFPFVSSTRKKDRDKGEVFMVNRPDVDNLTKSVLDVMTDMHFWEDDSQICELSLLKVRAENPHIEITISSKENEE